MNVKKQNDTNEKDQGVDSPELQAAEKVSVLFVCLGNICRSPTAHGIFENRVRQSGLDDRILVDSCGTGSWHVGEKPDPRAISAAKNRSYDLSHLRARKVSNSDFEQFDYILAMDRNNLADLKIMRPISYAGHLSLFLDFDQHYSEDEVPDPYYGGEQGFSHVIDLVESASANLLSELKQRLLLQS